LDTWNESEITKRASELSNLASKVWLYPSIDELKLEAYRNKRSQKKEVVDYTLDNYEHLKGDMLNLYKHLEFAITALDPSISVENKKLYIAFKTDSNFVDVVPQKSRLRLSLNVDLADIKDPKNLCEDVSGKGRWGNGNTQLGISKIEDIEYAMFVIKQAYEASL
jgi:predicted transport protein